MIVSTVRFGGKPPFWCEFRCIVYVLRGLVLWYEVDEVEWAGPFLWLYEIGEVWSSNCRFML